MPGAYDKRYEWVSGMAQMKKDGGIYVKTKMKGIAKRIAVTAIAVAVVFGGIQTASVRFDGKSNWSKLATVKGKAVHTYTTYYVQCSCGKT